MSNKTKIKRRRKVKKSLAKRLFQQKLFRALRRFSRYLSHATIFPALAVMLLLFSTCTDYYIVLQGYNDLSYLTFSNLPTRDELDVVGRDNAEKIKTQAQAVIYLFVLFFSVFYLKNLLRFFWAMPVLAIIPVYLVTTSIQSDDPERVISNAVLIFIAILTAALLGISQRGVENSWRNIYIVIFITLFLHQSASIVLYLFNGMDVLQFITSESRTGGYSGSPNNLANQAVIGIWAALSLYFSVHSSRLSRILCVVGLVVFTVNILMSGSGTGLLVGIIIAICLFGFHIVSWFGAATGNMLIMLVVSVLLLGAAVIFVFVTPEELFIATTDSLGKDASLTGRTDLWDIGLAAVAEKPFFGWGYDSHATISNSREFSIPLIHYHNGFLDTAISGGVLLLLMVLICMWIYISRTTVQFIRNFHLYPLFVAFLMLIMLNLTEYQLLRPHSQIWFVFLCILSHLVATHQEVSLISSYRQAATYVKRRRKTRRKR